MAHITTDELDEIARLYLDDLRACSAANAPEGAKERAELGLKVLRQGSTRMSGENNRLATWLKVAKAAGVPAEEQRILWDEVASGLRGSSNRKALASAKSKT